MRIGMWMVLATGLGLTAGATACGGTVDVFGSEGGASASADDDAGFPLPSGAGGDGAGGGPLPSSGVGSGGSPTGAGGAPASGSSSGVTGGSTSASSSSSSATGAGGGPVCDGTGVCDSCVSCAWNGPCQGYAQACLANSECVAILQCYQQCDQPDCTTPCWIPHPAGHADYLAASICVTCDNCYSDCSGDQVGCPEN